MTKVFIIIFLTTLVIIILATALFASKLNPLERMLEKRLPELIGPAKKYTVKIMDTKITDLFSGIIKDLYLIAEEVAPKESPQLEFVRVHLHNIAFDLDKIEKIENANFLLSLTQDSINAYLPQKIKEYPNLKVELKNDLVIINTNKKVWMFDVPIKVSGILEAEKQKKVNFRCSEFSVSGLNLPYFFRKYLEDRVNPLVDLTEMKIITNILNIKILENKLQIEGNARTDAPIYYNK